MRVSFCLNAANDAPKAMRSKRLTDVHLFSKPSYSYSYAPLS